MNITKPANLIFIAVVLLTSSCATFQKVEGVNDYSQVVLQVGDTVKAKMQDDTNIELTVQRIDDEYFYGEGELKIKKREIKKLEFNRFDTTKFYLALLGYLFFAVLFSG